MSNKKQNMAIDYTSGGPRLRGGLSQGTLKQMGEASLAKSKVGKYAETGLDDALSTVSKTVGDLGMARAQEEEARIKETNKKLDKVSEEVLALQGGLGTNYFDSINDDMTGLREQYLEADNDKDRAKIFQEMNAYKAETEAAVEARKSLADSNAQKLFSDSMTADDRHIITEFLGNKTTISKNAEGQRVHTINMPDGTQMMMTADEINGLQQFKALEFDEMLTKDMQTALSTGQTNGYYNKEETRRKIENSITDDNIGSLINDPMGGGGSFKNDLAEGLKNSNITYKQLGDLVNKAQIDPNTGKQVGGILPDNDEKFWYENITQEDIEAITDALTSPTNQYYDPKVTKSALTNYFSSIVDNNNASGLDYYEKSLVSKAEDKGEASAIQDVAEADKKKELGYNPSGSVDDYMSIFQGDNPK
jgi:hypothetical protein